MLSSLVDRVLVVAVLDCVFLVLDAVYKLAFC